MSEEIAELEAFDWFGHKGPTGPAIAPIILSIMQLKDPSAETPHDRRLRMLRQLSLTCTACSMCELGLKQAERNSVARDPHIFSSLNPTRFMLIGPNPSWSELEKGSPLVGAAFKDFDTALQTYQMSRGYFYITNVVKCFGEVEPDHIEKCAPFLQMEINIIQPRLIITLGAPAFEAVCPGVDFESSLCTIVKSSRFDNLPVFPIYHPTDIIDQSRRTEFYRHMKTMCSLVKRLWS